MDDVPGHSVSHSNEIRGDIIQFYNNVYMPRVQQFALKFSSDSEVSGERGGRAWRLFRFINYRLFSTATANVSGTAAGAATEHA